MYFKRLKIKDFGPIRDIEFNFEKDKVYHFVGDNDSGKSMVLDAMNILCHNIANIHVSKYVSDYADSFHILGEDFDGNIIEISRGDSSWYRLTLPSGEQKFYDKIGGNVPKSIAEIVNVYEDDLKKEKFNFRYSDDKILFMNTTPGENYSFFQKALGTDKVLNALKKANTLQNKLEKEVDMTRSKIEYEEEKLENNPNIDYIKEEIEMYRGSIKNTLGKLKIIYDVLKMMDKLEKMDKVMIPLEVTEFDWIKSRNSMGVIKNIKEISASEKELANINKLLEKNKNILGDKETVDKEFKVVDKIRGYNKYSNDIQVIENKLEVINEIVKTSKETESIKIELDKCKDKIYMLDRIESINQKSKDLDKLVGSIKDINNIYEQQILTDTKVNRQAKELINTLEDLRNKSNEFEEKETEVIGIDKERTEFMRDNSFCPVVANSVDKKCPFNNKSLEEIRGE